MTAAARIPAWARFVLLCLVVIVCTGCPAKTPPALFADAPPPLPEVVHVEGERHPEDGPPTAMEPGDVAAFPGLLVPEGLVMEWAAMPSEVEAWKAAAEHQQASCERDRAYGEAAFGQEWQAHSQCRADLRVAKWATPVAAAGCLVLGVLAGFGAAQVVP